MTAPPAVHKTVVRQYGKQLKSAAGAVILIIL